MSHGHGGGGGIDWSNPLAVLIIIALEDIVEHSELEAMRWGFVGKEGHGH